MIDKIDVYTCDGTGGSRKVFSTAAARTLLLLGISSADSTATRPAHPLPAKHSNMGHHGPWGGRSPAAALQGHCLHLTDTTEKHGSTEAESHRRLPKLSAIAPQQAGKSGPHLPSRRAALASACPREQYAAP